jgi:diguanylate cyclase (GGDEF)-like protein
VLQTVATRVTALLNEGQMMARLGGDEFAIVMPDATGPAAAGRLSEAIIEALGGTGEPTEVPIATSIGIALCPADAMDRQSLLNHANVALQQAKSEGG